MELSPPASRVDNYRPRAIRPVATMVDARNTNDPTVQVVYRRPDVMEARTYATLDQALEGARTIGDRLGYSMGIEKSEDARVRRWRVVPVSPYPDANGGLINTNREIAYQEDRELEHIISGRRWYDMSEGPVAAPRPIDAA